MIVVCLDLEGILIPEIWWNVAEKTGLEELKKTTRDISDYDQLMRMRLRVLKENGISFREIRQIIQEIEPLPGALEFSNWIRRYHQLIVLSDTFEEFFRPIREKLDTPTLFCHTLTIGDTGMIENYRIRLSGHKRKTVELLKSLNYRVIAVGDSFNDLSMLEAADAGILFRPPAAFTARFPEFPAKWDYRELKSEISKNVKMPDQT